HKNPMIRELAANSFKGLEDKIYMIEPLEYVEFANLMDKVYLIMTDSGGIQEEAPALGKPVIVLRTETERPEAVEAGTVKLVGINKDDIFNSTNTLINNRDTYEEMAKAINPYGDGLACERILKIIKSDVK
ncbi:MAG: UDP-N-acetylglucosamine 2-epimerase, partial [Clostridium sp.]